MIFRNTYHLTLLLAISLILPGCAGFSRYSQYRDSGPGRDVDVAHIPNAVPRNEPLSKAGNADSYVVNGKRYYVMQEKQRRNYVERGIASWYGSKFHGHRTSNGETYDMYGMTAAHRSLPLPSYVKVTNLANNKQVIVRVNDRGPFHPNRLIDLSYAAAKKLGITGQGTGKVELRTVMPGDNSIRLADEGAEDRPRVNESNKSDESKMYLQVGAFSDRRNAEALRNRLIQAWHGVQVDTGYRSHQKIYRVRIGPLASVDEADQITARLTARGFHEPHIVID